MSDTSVGNRVMLTGIMHDDPAPIRVGDLGTVTDIDTAGTVHVKWDSGRNLGLIPGVDSWVLADHLEM